MKQLTKEEIEQDITAFKANLYAKHPNPFSSISKENFEKSLSEISDKVAGQEISSFAIELMKRIALLNDGHTMLILDDSYMIDSFYPFVFKYFKDGYYVVETEKGNENILGKKLLSINNTTIDELERTIGELIGKENETSLNYYLTWYITRETILRYFNIISDSKVTFKFADENGEEIEIVATPKSYDSIQWIFPKISQDETLIEKDTYWFKEYSEINTFYFQYNSCEEMDELPLKKVVEEISRKEYKNVVIDLRNNTGGDEDVFIPVIEYLKSISDRSKLYILTSDKTYSSAINNLITLSNITNSITLGSIPHGSPTHFGEVDTFELPNSGIEVQTSTQLWEKEGYRLGETFTPNTIIEPSITDYLNGKDIVWDYFTKIERA